MDLTVAGGTDHRDLLHLLPRKGAPGTLFPVPAARYEVMPGKSSNRTSAQLTPGRIVGFVAHEERFYSSEKRVGKPAMCELLDQGQDRLAY